MADTRCCAIKSSDGQRCSKKKGANITRCNAHQAIMMREGPNRTELNEVTYVFKVRAKALGTESRLAMEALGEHAWRDNRDAYVAALRLASARQRELAEERERQYNIVRTRQAADIARTGINPDAVQDAARLAERQRQHAEHQVRLAENQARHVAWQAARDQRALGVVNNQGQAAAHVAPVNGRPLAAFANDRQNVHTSGAVKQTMDVIKEILKIEVPSEYRWNMASVSKTMSEIISECELTPASAWQMVAKYCSDERIYDLQPGIYGKVLDCVWQYIKKSTDKEDLKKILKAEMRDNIGMCAQGNLSRLTNILAGYVECVVVVESMADKLGRLLPPLMNIDDLDERLIAAARVFVEVELPEIHWEAWASGLLIDQEPDDAREMFIHDGVIDFVVFN